MAYLSTFLSLLFANKEFQILKINILVLSFVVKAFSVLHKKSFPFQTHEDMLLSYFLEAL